jgi:hypothetical protein
MKAIDLQDTLKDREGEMIKLIRDTSSQVNSL